MLRRLGASPTCPSASGPSLGASLLLALAGCAEPPGERAAVEVVEPADGAVVSEPDVHVTLEARGIEIASASEQRAGTAHHHLFVDRDPTPLEDTIPSGVTGIIHLGRGQTEFTLRGLDPGEHRVIAVLADPWHVPVEGAAADTVRFTVGGDGAGAR